MRSKLWNFVRLVQISSRKKTKEREKKKLLGIHIQVSLHHEEYSKTHRLPLCKARFGYQRMLDALSEHCDLLYSLALAMHALSF